MKTAIDDWLWALNFAYEMRAMVRDGREQTALALMRGLQRGCDADRFRMFADCYIDLMQREYAARGYANAK